MKRILIMTMALGLLCTSVSAQHHQKQNLAFKPYLRLGATLNSNVVSPGVEYGAYNDKMWFAVALSTTEVNNDRTWTASYKNYFKIVNAGVVDNYLFYAVNVSLEKGHQLGFEPGLATVFNVGRLAPQVSISFPTNEGYPAFKPLGMNFGVGLNYWIR